MDRFFDLFLSRPLIISRSSPFPDRGASCSLYRFQEVGKSGLEFPCLPRGENRHCRHSCLKCSQARVENKQRSLPSRSGGRRTLSSTGSQMRKEAFVLRCCFFFISSWQTNAHAGTQCRASEPPPRAGGAQAKVLGASKAGAAHCAPIRGIHPAEKSKSSHDAS